MSANPPHAPGTHLDLRNAYTHVRWCPAHHGKRISGQYPARPDGSSNAPMRSANSHMDLAVIRARHGDLDEAVHHGLAAFGYDRKTEASLLSRAADLDHIL
ncbi:MAG TPA: hypothetical protein VJS37_04115, partial [Terriglobales bacterium]|nr:hypothetical protein [Terriglobales bacterium]